MEFDGHATPAADAPPADAGSGTVEQLERLKKLLDEGALSQQEYETAKQRVLSGA